MYSRAPALVIVQGGWGFAVYRKGAWLAECTDENGRGISFAGPYVFTAVRAPGVVLTEHDPFNSAYWAIVRVGNDLSHPLAVGDLPGSVVYRVDSDLAVAEIRSNFDPDLTANDPSFKLLPYTVGYLNWIERGSFRAQVAIKYCTHADGTLANRCLGSPPGMFRGIPSQ